MPARDPRELFSLHETMRTIRPKRKSRGREIAVWLFAFCITAALSFALAAGTTQLLDRRANLAAAASPPTSFLHHIYNFFCPWFGGCLPDEQAGEESATESMGANAPATTSAEPQPKPGPATYAPTTYPPSEPAQQQPIDPQSSAAQPINQTIVNQPARTEPVERVVERERVVTEGGVSETTLADRLNQLENKLRALIFSQSSQQSAQTSAVSHAVALSQRIDNLSNTTITNPTITGGSITGSSIVGTISSAISTALATIDDLTSNELVAVNATFTNATSTTFYAGALGAGTASITNATTTNLATENLRVSSLDCTGYANGGTLTTDASGNVVCATDDGGAGSSVAGSDTQVQFNSGGGFAAAASFTFASSSGKLAVPYASTTALTATTLYAATASTTNLIISGTATTTAGNGFDIASGCFSVNGTCLTSGSAADGLFSTTSADYWDTTKWRWATTSSDWWLSQYSKGFFFSTTSADFWKSANNFFSTSSVIYWESTQWRWSTTSTNYWETTQTRWATTSSNYWLSQNQGAAFSTTSANAFLGSKTTDNLSEGATNKYYTDYRVASVIAGTTTSALAEGTNKYYTDARADARINATSSIGTLTSAPNLSTLATTLSGFLKATAGALSTAAINLASDITGILPVGNGGTGWANIAASAIPYGSGAGALATTTAGTGGYVLAYLNGVPGWTATTTFSAPLSYSGGAVSIPAANGSTDGYLSSADWNAFNTKFATTSSDYWISQFGKGFFFSTTSANAWDAAQFRWSTTSTDYWKTANSFFSTTSTAYWDSLQFRWATTSTDYWEGTKARWATTSSDHWLTQNQGAAFSTTSANYLLNASTTVPRTTLANLWTSLQIFANGFISNASSTVTSGLFNASGGASTTAFTVTDNSYFPGNGVWNNSGNVGIGTTTPGANLVVNGTTGQNLFQVATSTNQSILVVNQNGNVGIGTTSPSSLFSVASNNTKTYLEVGAISYVSNNWSGKVIMSNGNGWVWKVPSTLSQGYSAITFRNNNNTEIGAISINPGAGTTAYNTTSDRRLKENIATTTLGLDTLMRLPVRDFSFKSDPAHATTTGFIAQELQPIFPSAVTTNGDNGVDPLGATSTPWSVDYGRVTPLLAKSIQELNIKLEDLATTTPETSWQPDSFLSSFFIALKERLIAWVADAANGITDLFAKIGHFDEVHASKLCAGSTCVTETQLAALLSQSAAGFANPSPASAPSFANPSPTTSSASGTPPTIMIAGNNPSYINTGDTYQDLGATAKDSAGHDLGVRNFLNGALVSDIVLDTSTTSTNPIDYVATDTWGNTATATRTVIIEAPAAPVIDSGSAVAVPDAPPLAPIDEPGPIPATTTTPSVPATE